MEGTHRSMRKLVMMGMAAVLACGLAACGAEEDVQTQEVNYDMTFANQTGRNVSKLEIRPSEEADWSEITLTEKEWKNSFEMPVSLQGQIPLAEDGWQVQMTFVGDDVAVWDGIVFADAETITFSVEETGETAAQVAVEEATEEATEEALVDCNPADVDIADPSAGEDTQIAAEYGLEE